MLVPCVGELKLTQIIRRIILIWAQTSLVCIFEEKGVQEWLQKLKMQNISPKILEYWTFVFSKVDITN